MAHSVKSAAGSGQRLVKRRGPGSTVAATAAPPGAGKRTDRRPDRLYPTVLQCAILAGAIKLLLMPSYRSTDFEVHRNWLAITHSLPVREWYYEHTSEWTLDYPPFFAYFEYALSHLARLVDPAMLDIANIDYSSEKTVLFQRMSVILSELVLVYALWRYVESAPDRRLAYPAALSVLLSPGLLMIDHVHFQYNGFMYGLLVLSLVLARRPLESARSGSIAGLLGCAAVFAVLLCFKHIFLYLAPAYGVFLFRTVCLRPDGPLRLAFWRSALLGAIVTVVFGVAFGPFIYWGQAGQLLSRLFPFSRGLCHAYWAPNVWALYSFADRLLVPVAPLLGLSVDQAGLGGVTRGLVGNSAFAVLPTIPPRLTFVLTVVSQLPALVGLAVKFPTWSRFVSAVTLSAFSSFLFGWHVHEKAILLVIIPFSLVPAVKDRRYLSAFRPLAIAGHISLFPLLFHAQELPTKTLYTAAWLTVFLTAFDHVSLPGKQERVFLLDRITGLYSAMAIPLVVYTAILHDLFFSVRPDGIVRMVVAVLPGRLADAYLASGPMEFLPLMVMSVYSAVGILASWIGLMNIYIRDSFSADDQTD